MSVLSTVFRPCFAGRGIALAALSALYLCACGGETLPKCGDCSSLDGPCCRGVCDEDKGLCTTEPSNEGEECNDRDKCTLDDVCQGGECVGTPVECSEEESECIEGVCEDGDCSYVPREDGTLCISQTDECNDGRCVEGECVGEMKPDYTPCNDGDWCTTPDVCLSGECTGAARDCSDDLRCTEDACDSDRNACDHPVLEGWCLIGESCVEDGTLNPANSCQECVAAMNQSDWTNDDTNTCTDGNSCTGPDECVDGLCQGAAIENCCLEDGDCDDGKDCTTDTCNQANGTCTNSVDDGFCLVGDLCIGEGTLNPANACQECISSVSKTSWSNNDDECDDGLYCTVEDVCSGGACQGTSGVICDDEIDCTDDICSEVDQNCSHPIVAGQCLIGGTCYDEGDLNPSNPCQECISALGQTDWSPDDSNPCDDGNDCTDPDFCIDGSCTGDPIPNCCTIDEHCDDGVDCTDEVCDTDTGTCSNPVLAGYCFIGGSCYLDNDPNPNNNCQGCDASADQEAWSPANEGAECGGICQSCQGGTCENIPDTGDNDPFLECPACRVCNGAGGCRNATNGTDPKEDCTAAECSFDVCQAGSCYMTSGTGCTDDTPGDCDDAQCDGLGVCLQDFAFEDPGHACDDGDECTDPDVCDALGTCSGPAINPDPDPASLVSATSTCLTAGTGARSVVVMELVDTNDVPIQGASVTIEGSDSPDWDGTVVESGSVAGTYYRILQAPASSGSTTVTLTAQTGSGACISPVVEMDQVTIDFVDAASGHTGGCPIDNNLRVKVVDESGTALVGAHVMVGSAAATPFESNFENVLAGTASLPNTGQTASGGIIEFEDQGVSLEGPQMVTAAYSGMGYVTYVDVDASDLTIALSAIEPLPAMAQIDGDVTGLPVDEFDNILDAGMVVNQFGMQSLVRFKFDDLLAQEQDCWLATTIPFMGEQWTAMPVNLYIPEQDENYIFNITINEHSYKTIPIREGSTDQHIVALAGTAPFGDVANLLMDEGSLADVIPLLDMERIGLITRASISGDESNVPIPANVTLNANTDCAIENKPASLSGSGDLCLTIGDWDGTLGMGPMFIMGFRALEGGAGTVTTVPDSGSFAGVGYLGMGVAAYLDASALPAGDEWKSGATSGILDRSGSLGPGGGNLLFNDFLEITPLNRSGRSYQWNQVSTTDTDVHYTEHAIDLIEYITYPIGAECDDVTEDVWRNTYWKVFTSGATTSFSLPDIPGGQGWPLDASNGLPVPGSGEYLNWSFAAFSLGPLQGVFDFDNFDFDDTIELVTHTSTNNEDF